MRLGPKIVLFFLFCEVAFPWEAWPAEKEIEVGTLISHYVWRGIRLSEGAVYQSSVTVASRGFSLNVWGNIDFSSGKLNEADVTVSYSRDVKKFSVEAGLIHYGIFDGRDSTELFAGVAADCLLQPSLKAFFDVNAGKGAFLQASAGHSIDLSKRFSLDLKASVGVVFRNSFMGVPNSGQEFTGLHNAEVLVASPIDLGKGWEIRLQAGVSKSLSRNARQAIVNNSVCEPGRRFCNGTIVYGGASLTYSF
jgi:hypothetical protein